ncbi:single-stranded DNA-binding protein [Felid alphaherpesvirus 1]|nr:single-stranded DNA-binding protein [Felid alphaherpesvirus 1]ALJ84137.1 single-stranded DNA-binding protein [Felid alphaherpesvirus 1]ALJ84213.1 single-stranded DNA-binding protein [Felid alphaherpesvirus 1]ALJ84289.1 single-stranded DNA-binding protein [Felid alphaherpesvirus 1]ALJ84365.1 single-stranded DNA-binding protein [Felid alphaherpesvirus 1]
MESAPKTISLQAGPLGYIYACRSDSLQIPELGILSARSSDSDLAVVPLIQGLTVETGFIHNVAVLSGSKTSGLSGHGISYKLTPSHYHPNAFIFHGGETIPACSMAPNLQRACETARKRFGFSGYTSPPVDGAIETTAEDICKSLRLDPENTILYLVITETFKEAVYSCNTFLHYGGVSTVVINSQDVLRIPLYPIQLYMPDVNRVSHEPFKTKQRSICDEFIYCQPFFNDRLCRLIHGYILGPAAVSLRVRNLDALARGAAHLAFDEGHEGGVLPQDVTFTLFDSGSSATKGGSRTGASRGGDGASGKNISTNGIERRLASVMAADTALSIDSLIGAGMYGDSVPDINQWPMLGGLSGPDRLDALGAYVSRLAGLVGAMIFSSNSVLYMTEVDDGGAVDGKDGPNPSYHRFYLIPAPHVAGNPQTDKDGRVLPTMANQPMIPINGSGQEFSVDYLALICGFCPQIMARLLFYLERNDAGAFVGRGEPDAVKYLTNTFDLDVPCNLCTKHTRHFCVHTTLYRLRQRLPKFGIPTRAPMGIFGTMNSSYSDCDVLGNYASYGALRRPNDNEPPRSIMNDTYKATIDKLLGDMEQQGLLERDSLMLPNASHALSRIIVDHASFRNVLTSVKTGVEQAIEQFMRHLVEVRDFKIRDALADANHTMSISLEPYASVLCPVTSFLRRRTLLAIIQDLILSQCHCVFYGQAVEGRNFRVQFQPVLRKRFMDLLNGGFITSKTVTVTLADSGIVAPDLTKLSTEPPIKDCDGDIARVSIEVLREIRIKNRVLFATGIGGNLSDLARSRIAGMTSAYQRPERHSNILTGAVGFLLKQFHGLLFPNGHPPGSQTPNPQWYWTLLQRNQMPARLLSKEEIETITTVKRFSDEYAAINFINLTPNNMGELIQFYAANLILKYCDHSQFFINGITALLSQSKRPKDPASVISWISGTLRSVSDIEPAIQDVLSEVPRRPELWTGTYTSTNMMRVVMGTRPMVVLGLSVSKYNGSAGNNRVFQSGNWSGLNGGKNVCPLMSFDRTRKFLIACPRVGYTCEIIGGGGGVRDHSLGEVIKTIISEGGPMVQTAVFSAILNSMGPRVQHLELEDWRAVVDDEFLAINMRDINTRISSHPDGWSIETAQIVIKEMETQTSNYVGIDGDGVAFDFGTCGENMTGHAPLVGIKRPHPEDDLFDMSNVIEKKAGLTFDML